MDFDTSSGKGSGERRPPPGGGRPGLGRDLSVSGHRIRDGPEGEETGGFRIPAESRQVGEVRGREVDEAGLRRALYRSSMGEIEHILGPLLKGRRVVVEGRLAGTGRTALERLGAEVEELRLQDERRYIDMTPAIFVFAALAMAVRYISLGLDDQDLYILAGIFFALMYGLRPFFFKMQRPRDE